MKIETTAEELSKYAAINTIGLALAYGIRLKPFEMLKLQEAIEIDLTKNNTLKKASKQFDDLMIVII